jgi:transglutaminase-like putative cysteine protease
MAVAALALTAATGVAALSGGRLFVDPGGGYPAAAVALWVHAVLRIGAARRWSQWAVMTALLGGAYVLTAWTVVPGHTVYGLPGPDAFQQLALLLQDGMVALRSGALPAARGSGLELPLVLVGVLAAIGADRFAFGSRRPLSALAAPLAVLTLSSALGDGHDRAIYVVGFLVAACTFLLTYDPSRAATAASSGARSPSRPRRRSGGIGTALPVAVPVVALAALAAVVVGPRLPASGTEGLVELGERASAPNLPRVALSPLVHTWDDLRADPPVELFRVSATMPAYWRLTALDVYDGQSWSTTGRYDRARGTLPGDGSRGPVETLTQTFSVTGLGEFWLPAAYRPVTLDVAGARVNPETLALVTDQPQAAGLTYTVESALPRYSGGALARDDGTSGLPPEVERALTLPRGLPAPVARLAQRATAGARTPYEQALALQNVLRTEFTYSTDVPPGHDEERLYRFLVQRKEGYCEQFAAAFAWMARWLGLPTRVAVGYTPGTYDTATRSYRVTTAEAHAWPEVWFDGFGWVAFEPTPGRSEPSPANHTGTYDPERYPLHVEPGQAVQAAPDSFADQREVVEDLPPTPGAEAGGGAGGGPGAGPDASAGESGPTFSPETSATWRLVRFAVAALLLVAVAVALNVVARRHLRARRRSQAGTRHQIVAAWADVARRLHALPLGLPTGATPRETAARAARRVPETAVTDLRDLARLVEQAVYAPGEMEGGRAAEAWEKRQAVVTALRRQDSRA